MRTQGRVASLWRYPVKSMQGEELDAVPVSGGGLVGDRAHALVDELDGRIASAKDTRRWPTLFDLRASFDPPPEADRATPPVRIALPDGGLVASDDPRADDALSRTLGRRVRLSAGGRVRGDAPEVEEPGYVDVAPVHLLTTSTLERLRTLHAGGRFEVRRFRPNLVIDTYGRPGFVEEAWVGATLTIGDTVRLEVTEPCERCVMTTLAQGDLPYDPRILTTVARANGTNVGVYARVLRGGVLRRGQAVFVERPGPS